MVFLGNILVFRTPNRLLSPPLGPAAQNTPLLDRLPLVCLRKSSPRKQGKAREKGLSQFRDAGLRFK